MVRSSLAALMFASALVVLPACSFTDVHETVHRTVPAAGVQTVRVVNSVGAVNIRGWDKPTVDIVAVKSAHSLDSLKDIVIDVQSRGSGVSITTVNSAGGGFWNGGGVRYTIMVPANSSVDVTNETGGMRLYGIHGDVVARTTTGGMHADLGRVAGKRSVDMRVTTGGIDVTIARDSSATVDMQAKVGGVRSDFDSDHIGSGTGKIHLETTTGGVRLRAS